MQGLESGAALSVSLLILAVAAWQAFNTPPTNRAGTTFFLFCLGCAFYFVLLVVLWLVTYAVLSKGGLGLLGLAVDPTVAAPLVLVISALLLLLGVRSLPRVPDWDARARDLCLRLASIPREGDRLARELAELTPFAVTQATLDRIAGPELPRYGLPPEAVRLGAGNGRTAPALFAFQRAVLLRLRLGIAVAERMSPAAEQDPLTPTYRAYLAGLAAEREQARAQYEALMAYAARYFASPGFQEEKADELRIMADAVFARYARLLAMVVLACERTEGGRKRKLGEFGFDKPHTAPNLTRDHLAAVTVLVMVVLGLFQVTVVPVQGGRPQEGPFAALMVGLEFGISVLLGTNVAYRAIARAGEGGPRSFAWPPLAAGIGAGLVAVVASLVLRVLFRFVALASADVGMIGLAQEASNAVTGVLLQNWPFTLFALATTATLAVSCFLLGRLALAWFILALSGGATLAAALAATALLVANLLDRPVLGFLLPAAAGLGFCLGALVLPVFRLTLAAGDGVASGGPSPPPLAETARA